LTRDPVALALQQAIASATGRRFEVESLRAVGGGCIHRALEVVDARGGPSYFAKVNEASQRAMLASEAEGLAAIESAGALRTPRVVAQGDDGERAWLVLEWLELAALAPASAVALGESLAAQHAVPQARFGWERDNFIGASAQRNGWSDDWNAFWRDRRLHAQLMLAAKHRLPSRMIDRGERLAADCHILLRGHAPGKSLLHGDLWGGNAASIGEGRAAVFDPAVYVGDCEADIAMTELFGGFPADFIDAYRAHRPLASGYTVRRDLYNLYHVLNHANLFSGGYVRQAEQSIERLLAEIR
jgi:fructosamine-3-kinase